MTISVGSSELTYPGKIMAKLSIRPSDTVGAIFRLILAALCVISRPNVGEANVAITTYHYDNLLLGGTVRKQTSPRRLFHLTLA